MTETRNYYTTRNYEDSSLFGGILSEYDFDGHHTLSSMADKIIADWKFDEQCRKNIRLRENDKRYKDGDN